MVDIKREKESAETFLAIFVGTIILYIILTIIGIGFIYSEQYIVGIIFIICYVLLYYRTIKYDRK